MKLATLGPIANSLEMLVILADAVPGNNVVAEPFRKHLLA